MAWKRLAIHMGPCADEAQLEDHARLSSKKAKRRRVLANFSQVAYWPDRAGSLAKGYFVVPTILRRCRTRSHHRLQEEVFDLSLALYARQRLRRCRHARSSRITVRFGLLCLHPDEVIFQWPSPISTTSKQVFSITVNLPSAGVEYQLALHGGVKAFQLLVSGTRLGRHQSLLRSYYHYLHEVPLGLRHAGKNYSPYAATSPKDVMSKGVRSSVA